MRDAYQKIEAICRHLGIELKPLPSRPGEPISYTCYGIFEPTVRNSQTVQAILKPEDFKEGHSDLWVTGFKGYFIYYSKLESEVTRVNRDVTNKDWGCTSLQQACDIVNRELSE